MKYIIISSTSIVLLEETVNSNIKKDWHIVGGVSITYDTRLNLITYAQSMVKTDE